MNILYIFLWCDSTGIDKTTDDCHLRPKHVIWRRNKSVYSCIEDWLHVYRARKKNNLILLNFLQWEFKLIPQFTRNSHNPWPLILSLYFSTSSIPYFQKILTWNNNFFYKITSMKHELPDVLQMEHLYFSIFNAHFSCSFFNTKSLSHNYKFKVFTFTQIDKCLYS